jgi:hypothetical protein
LLCGEAVEGGEKTMKNFHWLLALPIVLSAGIASASIEWTGGAVTASRLAGSPATIKLVVSGPAHDVVDSHGGGNWNCLLRSCITCYTEDTGYNLTSCPSGTYTPLFSYSEDEWLVAHDTSTDRVLIDLPMNEMALANVDLSEYDVSNGFHVYRNFHGLGTVPMFGVACVPPDEVDEDYFDELWSPGY